MKNARFWVWINGGPVKVTVKPGQELHHFQSGPTDEGYHFESLDLYHEGDLIRRISQSGGRDCDGILEHTTEDFCSVDSLETDAWPVWMDAKTSVYDQYAQLSNY